MATSTLDTLSALLGGLTALTDSRRHPAATPALTDSRCHPVAAPAITDHCSRPTAAPALTDSRCRPVAAPAFSLEQVAEHCWPHDCWLVLYDRVYDVTRFLHRHPGGADILLENAGRDATSAFRGVGHSERAAEMMRQYQVGVLADHQCMWSSAE